MEVLNKIIKYGLLVLAFLLPIFFLPYTIFPTAINKQFLLSVFCLLLLILWLVKIVVSGRIKLSLNWLSFSVLAVILVFGVSTVFSASKTQSFWGMIAEPDSLFNFILYGLTFFLFANLIESSKEVLLTLKGFILGSALISVIFLLQSAGLSIFPWAFAKMIGFNPIGTVQAFGIFLGGTLVVLIALLGTKVITRKPMKILMIIIGVILFFTIFFVNFRSIWIQLLLSMAVVILGMGRYLLSKDAQGGYQEKNEEKNSFKIKVKLTSQEKAEEILPLKEFILPLTIIALSLILIFIRLPLFNVLNIPVVEVSPTYKATFDITKSTLSESPKNLILGSGPASFIYKYRLYRTPASNLLLGPNLVFNQGRSALPTLLLTTGILGILAVLLMLGIFIFGGLRVYFGKKHLKDSTTTSDRVKLACFAGGFYFFVSWFFYPINFALAFSGFLMAGLWLASLEPDSSLRRFKEISFVSSPRKAFFFLLGAVLLISGSIIGLFTVSQKYIASLNYAQGLALGNVQGPDFNLDKAITKIQRAIVLDGNRDIYYRALSQAFILKAGTTSGQDLNSAVGSAVKIAQMATQLNPQNSVNWLQLGLVYENIIPFAAGADQFAIINYQKAQELNPQDAQILFNIGRVHFTMVRQIDQLLPLLRQAEQRDYQKEADFEKSRADHLNQAVVSFGQAITLNVRYSAAYYLLGQTYELMGNRQAALQAYAAVLQLEPNNAEVLAKVQQLSQ